MAPSKRLERSTHCLGGISYIRIDMSLYFYLEVLHLNGKFTHYFKKGYNPFPIYNLNNYFAFLTLTITIGKVTRETAKATAKMITTTNNGFDSFATASLCGSATSVCGSFTSALD